MGIISILSGKNNEEEYDEEGAVLNPADVVAFKMKTVDEAKDACDALLNGRIIVLNFEDTATDVSQRIMDFVAGTCYSIDGNLQKVSDRIFIVSNSSVELTGDFLEKGMKNSLYNDETHAAHAGIFSEREVDTEEKIQTKKNKKKHGDDDEDFDDYDEDDNYDSANLDWLKNRK